jgi:hypothetical protein
VSCPVSTDGITSTSFWTIAGVEEVQADDLRRTGGGPGHHHDRDRGGVRRQDRIRPLDHLVQFGEQRELDRRVPRGRLDDEVPVRQVAHASGEREAAERGVPVACRQLPGGQPAVQRPPNPRAAGREGRVVDLADDDVKTSAGTDFGDAGTHQARPDHTDSGDVVHTVPSDVTAILAADLE